MICQKWHLQQFSRNVAECRSLLELVDGLPGEHWAELADGLLPRPAVLASNASSSEWQAAFRCKLAPHVPSYSEDPVSPFICSRFQAAH